ncbi:MAG: sensor histidine kinase [Oscillospiraceae bacterium]|nr:sensor histidine kinase [Oscillospiraceae bacterium]
MTQTKKQKNSPYRGSLKWRIVILLSLCWVLPVYLIVGGMGFYILNSMTKQAAEHISLSANTAIQLTTARLDSAVAASLKASYVPTISEAWNKYQQDSEAVDLYTSVNTFLYQQYKYEEKFKNSILTFIDDTDMSFYVANVTAQGSSLDVRSYHQYMEKEVLQLSQTLGTNIAFIARENRCYLVRNLVDSKYRPYAVLVNELNQEALFSDMENISWATDLTIWLNETPLLLLGDNQLSLPPCADFFLQQTGDCFVVSQIERRSAYTLSYTAHIQPLSLHQQRVTTIITLGLISVLLVPLFVLIFAFFRRTVTRPLQALNTAAQEIEKGNFGTQVSAKSLTSLEFGLLGDSFNTMSSTLLNQFERIYKEELALRDARIMALQSQINPHFMNNTLEIINWEARMEGNIKVCNMLESLSTMLNAAMDRKKRPVVHLSEELMYANAYLYIISERLGKRLTVEKDIPQSLLDYYVPRLVLQPILENAIEHGINPTQHGTVWMRAYEQEDWLIIEVENDGVTTYEDLKKIEQLLSDEPAVEPIGSTSLGIRNVHQRLRILYGPESGLFVNITKTGNTVCTIKIKKQQDPQ